MGADTYDPRSSSILAHLSVFKEEVDTSLGPHHLAVTVDETPRSAATCLEVVEELVKLV
jgi:hypothetical protein